MKALVALILCSLLMANAAFADTNALKPPRVYSPHGPVPSTRWKSSALAPRAGGSKKHVYGAPIQGPIFKMQPKSPHTPPK